MNLPEFLTRDQSGYISFTGHRIGLHHVLGLYKEGYSPEMLREEYPTLPLALIHKVIAFYLENQAEADAYVAAYRAELERVPATTSRPSTKPCLAGDSPSLGRERNQNARMSYAPALPAG